ncbi:MAG: sulfatase [Pseudomonadales bacterium]|nr:sulfatase [Pseudomonadales bacterium]
MRVLLVSLAGLALLGSVAWSQRLDLLLWAAPRLLELRQPVGPHEPVVWPAGPAEAETPPAERPPNVVLILADDLGFNDVSFGGGGAADGTVPTPNIDAIAREGVVFENGYAANAVCAPSRAAILTGRYATRFGFEYTPAFRIGAVIAEWANEGRPPALQTHVNHDTLADLPSMEYLGMPPEEITVAELLREAGYRTGHIGKWHLGGTNGMRPEDQGFDDSLYLAGMSYLPPDSPEVVNARIPDDIDRMVWASAQYAAQFNGGPTFEPGGYLTDWYTDEALAFLDANRHRPFFLYLAHWGVHNPLQALKSDYDALAHIEDHDLRVYAAMIRALDRSVGRILERLEDLGLAENTLVLFSSDNGGAGYLGLDDLNAPYRGWKLTHFEGGTHVPFYARWPARIPAGTRFDAPVNHIDLMPTIVAAAGTAPPQDRVIDGVDLLPFVTGEALAGAVPHETLFWHQGYLQTVQHGGWKLITEGRTGRRWLFDLSADPTEQRDLSAERPGQVEELEALLAAHDAEQAEPRWPGIIEIPVRIDRTTQDPYEPGEEIAFFPN